MHYKMACVLLAWLVLQQPALADDENDDQERKESGWLKVGVLASVANVDKDEDFDQVEVFLTHSLPWKKDGEVWNVRTQLDLTAGAIADKEKETHMGSIGPRVIFHDKAGPIIFDFGIRATILGDDKLGQRDVDGPFHFTSHFRIGFYLPGKLELGCRVQHMSNAGLSDRNPGLDLVAVDLARWF